MNKRDYKAARYVIEKQTEKQLKKSKRKEIFTFSLIALIMLALLYFAI